MDAQFERLVSALIDGNQCYSCGTRFLFDTSKLNAEGDNRYGFDYSCPGCEAEYAITVEDEKALLRLEYARTDEDAPEELIPGFQSRRKESLQRQSHPVKDLVEGYIELNAALTLLYQNRKRITEACDILREDGINKQDKEFQRRVHTDIHNYVASAYTFDEILQNVKPKLPTDGLVEDAIEAYKDKNRVIIGLRVYAQHQFTIPFSYSIIAGEGDDNSHRTITVKLEDVNTIDSDVTRHNPDGYSLGADYHYERVEGEYINIEQCVDLHYEVAEELVGVIAEHTENVYEDEIEDYKEVSSYTTEHDWE